MGNADLVGCPMSNGYPFNLERELYMSKQELINRVARRADTKKQKIDVSIVSRVTKCVIDELRLLSAVELSKILL
jgi:hypothetical protein